MGTNLTIRAVNLDRDLKQLAALLSKGERGPASATRLQADYAQRPPGRLLRRWVACDGDTLVGCALSRHEAWDDAGRFWLSIVVDPALRGLGIGTLLYDTALSYSRRQHANHLRASVQDGDESSMQFASRRGFVRERYLFESTLELASFEGEPFVGYLRSVECSGIRLLSLADAGEAKEVRRRFHALNRDLDRDAPSRGSVFPSFEEFDKLVSHASWFDPSGQLLAADGDRYVGVAAVAYYEDTRSAHNLFTGVEGAYRGRGIAQALKLQAIRYALDRGACCIRTDNDSQNEPMLRINRKLGYVAGPGSHILARDLNVEEKA